MSEQQSTALALPEQVQSELEVQREQLARLLGNTIPAERFIAVAYQATRDPKLAQADRGSVLKAIWDAASLGLEPSGILGEGYIVTRWSKALQGYEAQFAPGYRGLAQLARRSGDVVALDWGVVYDEDEFRWSEGTTPWIDHVPARSRDERSRPTHAYAWARDRNGQVYVAVLDRAEIEHVRGHSPTKDSGPWVSDWGEMAKKSAVRRLCKKIPLSPEIQRAVALDDVVELSEAEPPSGELHGTDRLKAALEQRPKAAIESPADERDGSLAEATPPATTPPAADSAQETDNATPPGAAPAAEPEAPKEPEQPAAAGVGTSKPPSRCSHPASAHKVTDAGVVCQLCGELLAERSTEPEPEKPKRRRRSSKPDPTESALFQEGFEQERQKAAAPPDEPAKPTLQSWTGTIADPFRLAVDEQTGKARFALKLDDSDGVPGGKAQVVVDYDLIGDGMDVGHRVRIAGELEMVPWPDDSSKPPYRRIHAAELEELAR